MRRKLSLYIEFTQGMNFEEFLQDDKTASAVVRKIEIIGEATKQLPKDVLSRFPEIPWSSMAKMRDKIVWKVISEELPRLKPDLEKIYQILRSEEQ